MQQKSINMLKKIVLLSVVSIICPPKTLITIATDPAVKAADRLASLGDSGKAIAIDVYESIGTTKPNPSVSIDAERVCAAQALLRLEDSGKAKAKAVYAFIANTNTIGGYYRLKAANVLVYLGEREKAAVAYESIATSSTITSYKLQAVEALQVLGETEKAKAACLYIYLSIANDPTEEVLHKFRIAYELELLRETEKAAYIYESIGTTNTVKAHYRLQAALALEKLEHSGKARAVYESIANDPNISESDKAQARQALAQLSAQTSAAAASASAS